MGEVYRARDTRLDRDVALKILPASLAADPDRLMRFEREAKALASLNPFAVMPDGTFILNNLLDASNAVEPPFVVMINWPAALKR